VAGLTSAEGAVRTRAWSAIGPVRDDVVVNSRSPSDRQRSSGLERFVEAQEAQGTYDQALRELRAGRKVSHWMWFVFPQLAGLGRSAMARTYALRDLDEARAYLAHPILGPRLLECTAAVAGHPNRSALQIFGAVDEMKLRSCLTLFSIAVPEEPVFAEVLQTHCGGTLDPLTVELIEHPG
jgi:uncharacterized protein (DUF1810 family)